MPLFRDLSIRTKLILLVAGLVSSIVLLVCASFVINSSRTIRSLLIQRHTALADTLAADSPLALTFQDGDLGAEILSSLDLAPAVEFACLVDARKQVLARFPEESAEELSASAMKGNGYRFNDDGDLEVSRIALQEGRPVGSVYLRVGMNEANEVLRRDLFTAAIILAGSLIAVILLTALLQRIISNPILRLADAAKRVSDEHDYSIRVTSLGGDELGILSDGFNTMLKEIQQRDRDLRALNEGLEERVNERTAALVQSNIELQQFAYIASHDLQTPLRAIAGFAQFLQKDYQGKLDASADDYIKRIVEGAKRMQQLINDLLAYSRVESRAAPFEPTNLNEVFDDAVALLHASIEDSEAKVTRDELPTVSGDRPHLSQLFQNLIGNGIKYHGDQRPRVHVSAERNGDAWTIAVCDNGIGINAEHHEQIFEIFRRLHTQQTYPGTGIGLAICRRIVHRHGGRMWLESEEGKGSTFFFTILEHVDESH